MTEIERKALALLNAVRDDRGYHPLLESFSRKSAETEALCRAIEREAATEARHAAELREQAERFSEAVTGFWNYCKTTDTPFPAALSPFIIAKPDPLEKALEEAGYAVFPDDLQRVRAAIEKRGGKIVWGEG